MSQLKLKPSVFGAVALLIAQLMFWAVPAQATIQSTCAGLDGVSYDLCVSVSYYTGTYANHVCMTVNTYTVTWHVTDTQFGVQKVTLRTGYTGPSSNAPVSGTKDYVYTGRSGSQTVAPPWAGKCIVVVGGVNFSRGRAFMNWVRGGRPGTLTTPSVGMGVLGN